MSMWPLCNLCVNFLCWQCMMGFCQEVKDKGLCSQAHPTKLAMFNSTGNHWEVGGVHWESVCVCGGNGTCMTWRGNVSHKASSSTPRPSSCSLPARPHCSDCYAHAISLSSQERSSSAGCRRQLAGLWQACGTGLCVRPLELVGSLGPYTGSHHF